MKYYKNRGRPIASRQTKNEGTILARNVKTLVESNFPTNTTPPHNTHTTKNSSSSGGLNNGFFFKTRPVYRRAGAAQATKKYIDGHQPKANTRQQKQPFKNTEESVQLNFQRPPQHP
jgi:hypothetical protein